VSAAALRQLLGTICYRFFQRLGDYRSAIRFLVLSRCHDEAFQLARQHHQMELYGEVLSDSLEADVKPQDFNSLALHFEAENNSLLAGKYYYHAGDYNKVSEVISSVLVVGMVPLNTVSAGIWCCRH
jgi:WD repeat-containing protein 19